MGARGNSGVIFSQILRGAAEVLGEAGSLDAKRIARAFRGASDAAYRAVRRPVEGTMLSEIRELAEEAEDPRHAVARRRPSSSRRSSRAARPRSPAPPSSWPCCARPVSSTPAPPACSRSSAASPPRSPASRFPTSPVEHAHEAGVDAIHQELSEFRYCTVFVVEGEDLDAAALEGELDRLGDSLLVVGDATALKVHLHTDDPGRALGLATAAGVIEGVEIANMHRQTEQREERLLEAVPIRSTRSKRASSRSSRAPATAACSRATARRA